jgi:glutaredoxin 3
MAEVKIYTTPTCHYCHMAKEYFGEHGVEFQEFDVSQDVEARQEMVEVSGQMGVPVIMINGEMVIGFDQGKIEQLLQKGSDDAQENGENEGQGE